VHGDDEPRSVDAIVQSRLYGELTERLFLMAGIQPGMSAFDNSAQAHAAIARPNISGEVTGK
jgi:hypothetical protein